MNVKDLKNIYTNSRDEIIKKTIEDINDSIKRNCKNGLSQVYRDSDDSCGKSALIYVEDWLIDVLKEHYENNGFEVDVEITKVKPCFIRKILNRIAGCECEPRSYRRLYIRWNFGGK